MTKTPAVYDFEAIGKTIATERPPEAGLAALWRRHDEMTDLLVDEADPSGRELSDAEWERLNAEATVLYQQIIASPAVSAGDIWAKFKMLESMADDDDPDHNTLRADISFALQNLAASSEPQPTLIGDVEVLAKFREWCAACRYAETIGDDFASEPAYNEACGVAYEIEDYLVKTPASGPIGLAIKVFLRHKDEHQGPRRDAPCKLCAPVKGERDGIVDDVEESLLRDAVRFLPELAPLCAAAIGTVEAKFPSSAGDDPIIALIAEFYRKEKIAGAAEARASKVLFALPKDVRNRKAQIVIGSESSPKAGRDDLLTELRAEQARVEAAYEASGHAALDEQAVALQEAANKVLGEIEETEPLTLAGVDALLKLRCHLNGPDDDDPILENVLTWLRGGAEAQP
jgi:hypothetical protein